jgi:hypothetical protein
MLRRFTLIGANALAVLLLCLVGVALAGPITIDGVQLFGPQSLGGSGFEFYFYDTFQSQWFAVTSSSFITNGVYYVVPFASSSPIQNLLPSLNSAASGLLGQGITLIVALPEADSIFSSPEPSSLAMAVSGIAGLAFLARRFRRKPDSRAG